MQEIQLFNQTSESSQIEESDFKEKQQEFKFFQSLLNNSINIFTIFLNEVCKKKLTKIFVTEMVDCMFSLCEHFEVTSQQNLDSDQFMDFKWFVENITLTEKRLLVNDTIFQKIQHNIKLVGEGNINELVSNQVDYSQEEYKRFYKQQLKTSSLNLETLFQEYDKNVSFMLQYVPRIYSICLNLYPLVSQDNFCSDYQQILQSIICNILKIDKVEYQISPYFQLSKEIFLIQFDSESDQGIAYSNQQFNDQELSCNLSCLSSLANMDINIHTNFAVSNKNLDLECENDNQEWEHDQLQFITQDPTLVNFKFKSIQLLRNFINQCAKIVIENKKFEIMNNIIKNLMNEKEQYMIVHASFKKLAKMFKSVSSYFLQNSPDLYLNNIQIASEENQFLSKDAKVEYAPLFDLTLRQICQVEQLNYEPEIEDLSYLLYKILKSLDNPTKRTFFYNIFDAIKCLMKNTKSILSNVIIQWCLLGLKLIYKAYPAQLQNNFFPIWQSLVDYAFHKQRINEDDDSYYGDDGYEYDNNYSQSSEQQMKIPENLAELQQQSEYQQKNEIDSLDNSLKEIIEEEEELSGSGNESQSNLQNGENESLNEQKFKTLQMDTSKIDLSFVSEIICSNASFVKYDKCVYPIISDLINQIILNEKYIEQQMVQRNSFYYLNKITRYCFESIQPNQFKKYYEIVKSVAESYKGVTDLNKRCITENIFTTYAIMTVKIVETKLPQENTNNDFASFNKLFSLIPFEGDYNEMQRVMKICSFLLEKNSTIIEQNLYNITLSIIYIIHDPLKYDIKSSKEYFYFKFYDKLVTKFLQVKCIAQSAINLNKDNVFNNQQQRQLKLKIV
ncbi:hypothetical protein ABPG72_019270 [Tetrahymena utriculariae]